jgi:hypothetical protein
MVTVVQRPQGNKIIDQAVSATIINSSGDALVTFPYHSLSTGDIIYITSDIDEYNGFLYVEVIDSGSFKLRSNSLSDFVEFYQEIDIEYYQTQPHDWSSIFLPIVYKISNDRWPTNSVDTARTISSSSDDNGFTQLTLSGALKGQFNALEFVKIESASDDDLNNVWQIVEVISTSDIVINLPYDAANSFLGATIQYYYNNYQVKVKVYSGLDPGHPWQAKKPYEEMAELSLTPDENNEAMFSVSDYIKSRVAIKNNLTLFSLPLNLDAFTGFYIQTAESYDDSDNYSLFTTQSDFTQDSFEGYAIAGKLPFKNIYAGDYADYVYTSGSPARWLTNRTRLLAVEDLYFDISFIKNIMGNFFVRYMWYVSDYLTLTETVQFTDQGIGVYRIPVTPNAVYDSVCIDVFKAATTGFTPAVMDDISLWTNLDTGGPPWAISATPEVDFNLLGLNITSDTLYSAYAFDAGQIYSFGYTMEGTLCGSLIINIYDVSMNVLSSVTIPHTVSPQSGTYTFTAPAGATGIGLVLHNACSCGSGSGGCIRRITAFTNDTTGGSTEPALAITEEICIDIIEQCDVSDGISQDDRRLLEDGDFRLLE